MMIESIFSIEFFEKLLYVKEKTRCVMVE